MFQKYSLTDQSNPNSWSSFTELTCIFKNCLKTILDYNDHDKELVKKLIRKSQYTTPCIAFAGVAIFAWALAGLALTKCVSIDINVCYVIGKVLTCELSCVRTGLFSTVNARQNSFENLV